MNGSIQEFVIARPASSAPVGILRAHDGSIWFADAHDKLGRIRGDGTIEKFLTSKGSSPGWLTTTADGAIWFSETGTTRIARLRRN